MGNPYEVRVFPHRWDCLETAWGCSQSVLIALHGQSGLPAFPLPFSTRNKYKKKKQNPARYCIRSSKPTGIFPVLITTQEQIHPSSLLYCPLQSVPAVFWGRSECAKERERKLDWPVVTKQPTLALSQDLAEGDYKSQHLPRMGNHSEREIFFFFFFSQ